MNILLETSGSIFATLRDMKSVQTNMFHSLGGLTGALRIMMDFIEKRIKDEDLIEPVLIEQLEGTLKNIDKKLKHIKDFNEKRCLGVPYGKMWIFGGMYCGLGGKRILSQLKRLEADLAGDLQMLDLQIQSTQARALTEIAGGNFLKHFKSSNARKFWASNFSGEPRVSVETFVKSLKYEVDSSIRNICRYATAQISMNGSVEAIKFADAVDETESLTDWVLSCQGFETILVNSHSDTINCMTTHRGHIITGSSDKTVKIFHIQKSKSPLIKNILIGHTKSVNDVSCQESIIATASDDKSVKIWNMMDGKTITTLYHKAPVKAVFFASPDLLVTATQDPVQNITAFNTTTWEIVSTLYGHVGGTSGIFTVGSSVFTIGNDRSIRVWDAQTGILDTEYDHAHKSEIECVTADQNHVATNAGPIIRLWRKNKDKLSKSHEMDLGTYGVVHDMTLYNDLLYIVASDHVKAGRNVNNRLLIINPNSRRILEKRRLRPNQTDIYTTSITVLCNAIYIGYSNGDIEWITENLTGRCTIGKPLCNPRPFRHSTPIIRGSHSKFLVSGNGETDIQIVYGNNSSAITLPTPVRCVCVYKGDFLIGSDSILYTISQDAEVKQTIPLEGTVRSMFCVDTGDIYAQLYDTESHNGKYRENQIVKITNSGVSTIARDVNSSTANIFRFGTLLVYPRVVEGEIGLYDIKEGGALPPISSDDHNITLIRAHGNSMWTVHGDMDIRVWDYDRNGYLVVTKEFPMHCEVSDLTIHREHFFVAFNDGSVTKFDMKGNPLKTYADHRAGPVSLVDKLSLGSERRISRLDS